MNPRFLLCTSIGISSLLTGCNGIELAISSLPSSFQTPLYDLLMPLDEDTICRKNLKHAANAAAEVNQFKIVRLGESRATTFHADASDAGGKFVTGCQSEVVFNRTGIVKFRYNVTQVGIRYYVGTAPFNY